MPYCYKDDFETMDDIKNEYEGAYKTKQIPGAYNENRHRREIIVRERERYYESKIYKSQTAPRPIDLSYIDLNDRYQIMEGIDILESALNILDERNCRTHLNLIEPIVSIRNY